MATVSLNLQDWAKTLITKLYQSTPQNFDATFNAFIANDATITFNGQTISREEYKKVFRTEKAKELSAEVNFLGAVDAPIINIDEKNEGAVGVFFNAHIHKNIPNTFAPVVEVDTSSVYLFVNEQAITHTPAPIPGTGIAPRIPIPVDLRRAFTIYHVSSTVNTSEVPSQPAQSSA